MIAQKSETGYTEYEIPGVGWVSPTGSGYTTTYTLTNQRGDTVGLAVGSTLTNIRDYDAYGGFYTLLANSDSDHRYVGSKGVIWNNASQTYTMGLREYSPYLGRFLNQDPIGYKGGLNLYTYCGNEPVMGVDPSGKERYVIVAGPGNDTPAGEPESRFTYDMQNMASWLEQRGDSVVQLSNPTFAQLKRALKGADGLIIFAHGSAGNAWIHKNVHSPVNDRGDLSAAMLQDALGGRKLKVLSMFSCSTLALDVKLWKETASEVFGSTDVAPHAWAFGSRYWWGDGRDWTPHEGTDEYNYFPKLRGIGRVFGTSDLPHTHKG